MKSSKKNTESVKQKSLQVWVIARNGTIYKDTTGRYHIFETEAQAQMIIDTRFEFFSKKFIPTKFRLISQEKFRVKERNVRYHNTGSQF